MWNKALNNGLVGGLIGVALTRLGTVTGVSTMDPEQEWSFGSAIFMVIGFAISIYFIHRAMTQYRDEDNNGIMSYGQGLGVGVLTALVMGVITAVYLFLHYNFIDPSMLDQMREAVMESYEDAGMSEDEIDSFKWLTNLTTSPTFVSAMSILNSVFFGFLISLVVAAITKRDAPGS